MSTPFVLAIQSLSQVYGVLTALTCIVQNPLHSTLAYPALPNPVTSLYIQLSGGVAMVNMVPTCTGTHNAWSRAHGRIYMRNVQCMHAYTCISFTLHSELRAYLSYRHPPVECACMFLVQSCRVCR